MTPTIEELLGIKGDPSITSKSNGKGVEFSFFFFSDTRKDIRDSEKYSFLRDVTLFADREGFEAVYLPERHFSEFGSIFANPAIIAAYLIPQTKRIRFRTAGVTLPLHHPAEVVEWWAMNDVLSGGRVDLGFGSGWNEEDFILSPAEFEDRKLILSDRIEIVKKLWRGDTVKFLGANGVEVPTRVYPSPIQDELNVWLLVAQSDGAFEYAGRMGYNVFTMLYGVNLAVLGEKIRKYRRAREEAGLDPTKGRVTLMLHTLVYQNLGMVREAVEKPFKEYIKTALNAHLKAGVVGGSGEVNEEEKSRMLEYSYERYFRTGALFGAPEDARKVIDESIEQGVDEIACLVDFGVDYSLVLESLSYLKQLISVYR
jgi:natural product biosynthesis luciferase-like monooxygenase protein